MRPDEVLPRGLVGPVGIGQQAVVQHDTPHGLPGDLVAELFSQDAILDLQVAITSCCWRFIQPASATAKNVHGLKVIRRAMVPTERPAWQAADWKAAEYLKEVDHALVGLRDSLFSRRQELTRRCLSIKTPALFGRCAGIKLGGPVHFWWFWRRWRRSSAAGDG